jgi:hypothetical protein
VKAGPVPSRVSQRVDHPPRAIVRRLAKIKVDRVPYDGRFRPLLPVCDLSDGVTLFVVELDLYPDHVVMISNYGDIPPTSVSGSPQLLLDQTSNFH